MRTEIGFDKARPGAWVVVNTQPLREQVALEHLERRGFRAYCPMISKRVTHARRTRDVLRPLFPSYLFVEVDLEQRRWRPILSTHGVRTLVRCGDQPSPVDDRFIQCLKAREVDGAVVRPANPYRIGQAVRLSGGAFDSLVATIVEMDEKDRLVVLMDLLSRPVKVKVEARWVTPVWQL